MGGMAGAQGVDLGEAGGVRAGCLGQSVKAVNYVPLASSTFFCLVLLSIGLMSFCRQSRVWSIRRHRSECVT